MTDDERFRQVLRWYPASWRRVNGDVVAGTMREVAEAEGRDRPSRAETRAARVNGLAHRLDRKVAIGSAVIAVVLSIIGIAATIFVPAVIGAPIDSTLRSVIGPAVIFSVPTFLVVSAIATLRVRGLRASAALWSLICAVLATVPLGLAVTSWSVAFDEADAGAPRSLFGAAWMLFAAISALASAATGAVLVTAALAPRLRGWEPMVGIAAGVVAWPILVTTMPSPGMATLAAIAMLVLAVIGTRPRGEVMGPADAEPMGRAAASDGRRLSHRWWIAALAGLSFILGVAAVVFALAGSQWSELDATQAMRVGIGAGALAAIPLIGCLGIARSLHRPRDGRGPVVLLACAAAGVAIVDFTSDGDGNAIVWQLLLCALPVAGAAVWMILTSRRSGDARVILAASAALTTLVLSIGLQAVPFVTPLVAMVVAILALVRPRRHARPFAGLPPQASITE